MQPAAVSHMAANTFGWLKIAFVSTQCSNLTNQPCIFPPFLEKSLLKCVNQRSCLGKKNMQTYTWIFLYWFRNVLWKTKCSSLGMKCKVEDGDPGQVCASDLSLLHGQQGDVSKPWLPKPLVGKTNRPRVSTHPAYDPHTVLALFQRLILYSHLPITVIQGRWHQEGHPTVSNKHHLWALQPWLLKDEAQDNNRTCF